MAGGDWGGLGAPQQHRQPLVNPPSPDSTDPKISAFYNMIFTLSRSSTVRTRARRTSWAPRRNNTKASAPSSKEPPLPSTPSFLGVGGTIYNNHTLEPLKSLTLILKELWYLLPSFMSILSITLPNLLIPDVSFPGQSSTRIRRRFQVKPATLLIPFDIFFFL